MRNFCASLPDDRKVAIYERAPQEETVTDSGGFLSLQNSKTVLAKFISTLSTGVDTKLQADYIVMTAGSKFLCTIVFPVSAPIRAIDGRPENSKVQARSAAAYQACKTLIKMGYINANLQPVFRTRLPKMLNAWLALSSKNGDQYEMILRPEAWSSLPDEIPPQLYATVISFKGSHPLEDILILTRGPLPDITAISLFVDATTKYEASMAPYGDALDFSTKEIEKLADFTLKLFDDLFSKNFDANANTLPYFLAPHLRDSSVATPVDWAYMDQQNPMPLTNTYQSSLFTDPFDGSRKFITFGVNTNLKPLEVTPDDVSRLKCRDPKAAQQTIADFSSSVPMKKRIGQAYDPEQNVYKAELLSLRRNFLERDIVDGDANVGQCHIISEPLRESTVGCNAIEPCIRLTNDIGTSKICSKCSVSSVNIAPTPIHTYIFGRLQEARLGIAATSGFRGIYKEW
jgi:endoribonuclease Dicer